jgi:hypothetical protein
MNGSSQPSHTTQTTEPPAFIRPFMQYGAEQARSLYETGGPRYYSGNTVVPFSSQTEQALGLTEQRALQGSPVTRSAQNYATGILGGAPSSQFGSAENPYASAANPFGDASNPFATGANPYGDFKNPYAGAPNPFGAGANPALDAMFNRGADAITQRLQSSFAGSGRNIDAASPAAADEFGSLYAGIYGPAFENERNRQLQYQQQLTGIGADSAEAERGRQLAYGQQQLGIGAQGFEDERARQAQYALAQLGIGGQGYENERSRMADDLERQRSLQFGVAGLAPSLAAQDYADINALRGVGGEVEDLTGRLMEDSAARWDFDQNAPQVNLDNYLARITGSYPGGTTTGTTPTYRNRAAGALGGAATGAGLASGLMSAGAINSWNPWGWGLMAAGGLLGAM